VFYLDLSSWLLALQRVPLVLALFFAKTVTPQTVSESERMTFRFSREVASSL